MTRRGACATCGRHIALTKAGRVRWHHGIGWAGCGRSCIGVGRPPLPRAPRVETVQQREET